MTLNNELEPEDFTFDQWGALCKARKHGDNATWWRLLRELTGYTSGRHALRRRMVKIVDEWLDQHPSWTGRWE